MKNVAVMWFMPIIVTLGAAWLISRQAGRGNTVCGIDVDPAWRRSAEAAALLRLYTRAIWCIAILGIAAGILVASAGYEIGIALPALASVLGFAAAWGFIAHRVRLHAAQPSPVRVAALDPEPPRLPGGWIVWLLPLALLAGTAVYLHLHWDAIPSRFPIHWDLEGRANGWSERTLRGVFTPVAIGFATVAGTLLLGLLILRTARRPARASASARRYRATMHTMLIVSWILAVSFSIAGLLPIIGPPPILAILLWVLATTVLAAWPAVRASFAPDDDPDPVTAPPNAWKLGMFYFNPDDPALFVDRRFGVGWTLNMAHWPAWVILGAALLPAFFALWRQFVH